MPEPASIVGSAFSVIRGLFTGIHRLIGLVIPKVDITFEPGKAPFEVVDEVLAWVVHGVPGTQNSTADQQWSPRRLYRVGLRNRALQTIDEVRVELVSVHPPVVPDLPVPLTMMHGLQPVTLHRASEPTAFAEVALKVDRQPGIHIRRMTPSARDLGGLPGDSYRIGIRVTGRAMRPVTKHFLIDVDSDGVLSFSPAPN